MFVRVKVAYRVLRLLGRDRCRVRPLDNRRLRIGGSVGDCYPVTPIFLCACSYFFSQADVREVGTLTEYELSSAMRSVMGATPKAGETSRVLHFFGERGAEGEKGGKRRRAAWS